MIIHGTYQGTTEPAASGVIACVQILGRFGMGPVDLRLVGCPRNALAAFATVMEVTDGGKPFAGGVRVATACVTYSAAEGGLRVVFDTEWRGVIMVGAMIVFSYRADFSHHPKLNPEWARKVVYQFGAGATAPWRIGLIEENSYAG